MNLELCDEAAELGRLAHRALEAAGGDDLVRAAEREPGRRQELVAPVLAELGTWDLDPRAGPAELEAAAAVCRSAGYWGLAYPVAERLSRFADLEADGSVVVAGPVPRGAVAALDLRFVAVTLDGARSWAHARRPAGPAVGAARDHAFVVDLDLEPIDETGSSDAAFGLLLPSWTLLGFLDRAVELTCEHVLDRRQFGRSLASFQGVQFQLTEAEVERLGCEELAKYALWSVQTGGDGTLLDVLALRLAAIEAADTVFRVAHQLHGAIGFCDETSLSWLSRYSAPLRRLPLGSSATAAELARRAGRRGLAGLFGPGPG